WWDDYLHASKYGSYLDALVQFGTITGLDPLSLGAGEVSANDLGIASGDALVLQRIASAQLGFAAAVPEPSTWLLLSGGLLLVGARRTRRGTRR
ncbi:MAG: PEP-CTERM sorting domain-containing protein, partial [Caldimonas sp.]